MFSVKKRVRLGVFSKMSRQQERTTSHETADCSLSGKREMEMDELWRLAAMPFEIYITRTNKNLPNPIQVSPKAHRK